MTNDNSDKYWKALIIALVIFNVIALIGKFAPDVHDINVANKPEQQRQRIITGRETKDKELAVDTLRYLAATKAAKQEANYWQAKYLSATKKGSGIEQRYLKNKNVATCDTLLANKEERITDLLGNLEAVKKDSTAKSVLIKDLAGHVKDRNLRIDTLDAIAKKALKQNAKKWGVGVQLGYGLTPTGHTPYIGIGVQYNIFRF